VPENAPLSHWYGACDSRLVVDMIIRGARIVLGFVLLGSGIAMLALPGPGWLTIAAALAILAVEFEWARRVLERLKQTGARGLEKIARRRDDG